MSDAVPAYVFEILDAFLNGTGLDTSGMPPEVVARVAAHQARTLDAEEQWVNFAVSCGTGRQEAEALAREHPEWIDGWVQAGIDRYLQTERQA
jgi:hypothetical protein